MSKILGSIRGRQAGGRGVARRLGVPVISVVLASAAIAVAGCGGGSSSSSASGGGGGGSASGGGGPSGTVAFLLPDTDTSRWEQQDRPSFIAAMHKLAPNVKVVVANALNDPQTQANQADAALTKGAKALVVTPVDQQAAATIVAKAKAQGVPVIAYDRMIQDAPVSGYVSVDGVAIGKLQGNWLKDHTKQGDNLVVINGSSDDDNAHLFNQGYMSVLKPLFDSGQRKLVYQAWTKGWEPSTAQREMEQALTKNNNNVQGVLSANDGMAGGIVSALKAQGMAGKIPVTGLDGTPEGLQRILRGTQGMSAWRSLNEEAMKAAQGVVALVQGQQLPSQIYTKTKNNGSTDVAWAPVTPHAITKDNMQLVIDDGGVTKAQVCKGIASGVGPC